MNRTKNTSLGAGDNNDARFSILFLLNNVIWDVKHYQFMRFRQIPGIIIFGLQPIQRGPQHCGPHVDGTHGVNFLKL